MSNCKMAARRMARALLGRLPPAWQHRFYDTALALVRAVAPHLVKSSSRGEHLVRNRELEFRLPDSCVDEIVRMADTLDTSLAAGSDLRKTVFISPAFSAETLDGQCYFALLRQLDSCHAAFVFGWERSWSDVPEWVRDTATDARNVLFISLSSHATASRSGVIQSVGMEGVSATDPASIERCGTLLATLITQRTPAAVYVSRHGALADSLEPYREVLAARSGIVLF